MRLVRPLLACLILGWSLISLRYFLTFGEDPGHPAPSSFSSAGPRTLQRELLPANHQPTNAIEPKLFVAVLTAPKNVERRMSCRESWMTSPEVQRGDVKVRFFVGTKAMDEDMRRKVESEAKQFGDVVLLEDLAEGYYKLLLKTVATLRHSAHEAPFLLRSNDDTLVLPARLLAFVQKLPPEHYIYSGFIQTQEPCIRDPTHEFYISTEDFPGAHLPDFANGAGYLMSRGLATYFAEQVDLNVKAGNLEDVSVGMELSRFRRELGVNITYVHSPQFTFEWCDYRSIIVHPIIEETMKCSWFRLVAGVKQFCCAKIQSQHKKKAAREAWAQM
ncbi:hypothetical protein QOT17_007573 [Balamuthia mandrillaris]